MVDDCRAGRSALNALLSQECDGRTFIERFQLQSLNFVPRQAKGSTPGNYGAQARNSGLQFIKEIERFIDKGSASKLNLFKSIEYEQKRFEIRQLLKQGREAIEKRLPIAHSKKPGRDRFRRRRNLIGVNTCRPSLQ